MHRLPSSVPPVAAAQSSAVETVLMTAVGSADLSRRLRTAREVAPGPAPTSPPSSSTAPSLSVVIPLFNAAPTIAGLVEEVFHEFADEPVEVILVNDGSSDDTEPVARRIAELYHGRVIYVQLARNYGEHPAVMAGLEIARGRHVAIIDDDGQNPPAEIRRLRDAAAARRRDVVYGRYLHRRHSWPRRTLSGLHNYVADWLFDKPRGLYLSSFKVLSRFAVDEICRSAGPYPHLDGLILQLTRNFEQVDVLHRPRRHGRSGYTPAKLTRLWLDFVVGSSTRLFRPALFGGAILPAIAAIGVPAAWLAGASAAVALGAGAVAVAAGLLLFYLGLLGECLSRAAAACAHRSPFVVRYLYRGGDDHE
jgi:undecaprenyl-phosphate 4-deoxy-4-formamido-L-arabinose transferase